MQNDFLSIEWAPCVKTWVVYFLYILILGLFYLTIVDN